MQKLITVAVAAALLAGCADAPAQRTSVVVAPYEVISIDFATLEDFVADRPHIVTAKVVAVNELAHEVPVDPKAEGNVAGEGPEIYGTITFEVDGVVKGGRRPGDPMTIVYLSGKWNDAVKRDLRIAYVHERMEPVQTRQARLRTPEELRGQTFVLFAAPKPPGIPVGGDLYVAGVARLNPGGQVVFGGSPPFKSGRSAAVTLADIRAAVK